MHSTHGSDARARLFRGLRGDNLADNMDRDMQSTAASTLLFGSAIGIALLLGESVVAVLNGGQLKPLFFLAGLPAYGLFGLLLGVIPFITGELAKYLQGTLSSLVSKPGFFESVISVTAILVQGAVVVNELVLSGSPFSSPLSILIDLIWVFLIVALFMLVFFVGRGLPSRVSRVALFWGVVLGSYCISSLYFVIDRPLTPVFRVAVSQTLFGFFLASVSLITPILAYRLAVTAFPRIKLAPVIAPAVSAVTLAAVFFALYTTIPAATFEQRPSLQPPAIDKPNVILIVVDTLRADHLSSYGYHRPTSPRLDEFIRDSVKFENCISPANWTPPGHASIFTGRFPISHGAHKVLLDRNPEYPICFPLEEAELTIAEILAESGYRTAAVVGNFVFVTRALGLDQGFQFWFATPPRKPTPMLLSLVLKFEFVNASRFLVDPVPYRRASDIKEISLKWIRQFGDRPFFLFVNFMDPHHPYSPPNPWADSFASANPNSSLENYPDGIRKGLTELSDFQWSHVISRYDGEVAYVDSELGDFFSQLKTQGHYSDSIILVTSDHGEFLGEHGLIDHQIGLYQPVTRVPLIFKPAHGTAAPVASGRVVQTVDILPTILDSLGIEIPDFIQGSSLLRDEIHPIIAQHYADLHISDWYGGRFRADQISLILNMKKLILSSDGTSELFNLAVDPGEEINLANTERETRDQMSEALARWLTTVDRKVRPDDEVPNLDAATIRRLRSLGYVQ